MEPIIGKIYYDFQEEMLVYHSLKEDSRYFFSNWRFVNNNNRPKICAYFKGYMPVIPAPNLVLLLYGVL